MSTIASYGDPDSLSRPELVSLYINGYYKLDAKLRAKYEAAFRKRRLPLPAMPAQESPATPRGRDRLSGESSIDRSTFLSYILLIYSGTAFFYSWLYLAQRLVKMDFGRNTRHKLIQTGIALFYVVGEILLFDYFAHLAE